MLLVSALYCAPARRKRKDKSEHGGGLCPELAVFGFHHGQSAALTSLLARQSTLMPSFEHARQDLARRGLKLNIKVVHRSTRRLGEQLLIARRRDLQRYRDGQMPAGSELAGKRVCAQIDGGRVRLRKVRRKQRGKGKNKKQKRRYKGQWREPKVLTIFEIDDKGQMVRKSRARIDGTFRGPDEVMELLAMHLHRLGAAQAEVVVFLADGAPWIWERLEWVVKRVGLDSGKVAYALDWCHALHHVGLALAAVGLPDEEHRRVFKKLRKWLKKGGGVLRFSHRSPRRGIAVRESIGHGAEHPPERARLVSLQWLRQETTQGQRAMPENQPTAAEQPRQEPFRWSRADVAAVLDNFAGADQRSQRHFAEQLGIPPATFNYWTRHYCPGEDDPVAALFYSAAGELLLRRIVLAALCTFQLQGACGIRTVGTFLERAGLDRFVASSRGALHPLAAWLESDLVAFRDSEQPALAQQMKPRTITLVPDEHFHAGNPCLVGQEPVSGFIPVECYRDNRNADTWKEAVKQGMAGMPVEVVQMTSDEASALICLAEKGFQAMHSPDLFHGQHNLLKPLLLPLVGPIQQAEKELHKAKQRSDRLDTPLQKPQTEQQWLALIEAVQHEQAVTRQLEQAGRHKDEAVQQVRGVGDDYHPFDRQTGKPVTAEEVGKRLNGHLDKLAEVVAEAGLGEKAKAAVNKSRTWVGTLVACVAWFWSVANARVEELELSEEQGRALREKLLPGQYWEMAAGRGRTAQERQRLKEMAEGLNKEAWREGGPLSTLSEEARKELAEVAQETAGLFQRSSSSVEGRNGRLSLQKHGHSRVSEKRLKALTVVHNYMVKRTDGTTAAQRFFGQQHKDAFSWLLDRMPDLPRPAEKRRKPTP